MREMHDFFQLFWSGRGHIGAVLDKFLHKSTSFRDLTCAFEKKWVFINMLYVSIIQWKWAPSFIKFFLRERNIFWILSKDHQICISIRDVFHNHCEINICLFNLRSMNEVQTPGFLLLLPSFPFETFSLSYSCNFLHFRDISNENFRSAHKSHQNHFWNFLENPVSSP